MIFPFLLLLFEINNLKKETTPIKEVESARGDWIQVFTTSTSVVVVVVVVVLLPPLYGRIMFTLARGNGTSHILPFRDWRSFFSSSSFAKCKSGWKLHKPIWAKKENKILDADLFLLFDDRLLPE